MVATAYAHRMRTPTVRTRHSSDATDRCTLPVGAPVEAPVEVAVEEAVRRQAHLLARQAVTLQRRKGEGFGRRTERRRRPAHRVPVLIAAAWKVGQVERAGHVVPGRAVARAVARIVHCAVQ